MTNSPREEEETDSEEADEAIESEESLATEPTHRALLSERLAEAGSSLTYNPLDSGAWSVERAKHDLRVSSTAHKQREEALAAKHQRI